MFVEEGGEVVGGGGGQDREGESRAKPQSSSHYTNFPYVLTL